MFSTFCNGQRREFYKIMENVQCFMLFKFKKKDKTKVGYNLESTEIITMIRD